MEVRRTVRVKLDVPDDRWADLHATLRQFNDAANYTVEHGRTDDGYSGLPLESMDETLRDGDRIRLAKRDELFPNVEVWFASNDLERTALENALTADLGDHRISISPIELQLAYKLRLAHRAGRPEGKDFEDALHLYLSFGERLNTDTLEAYVEEFGVDAYYDELRRV